MASKALCTLTILLAFFSTSLAIGDPFPESYTLYNILSVYNFPVGLFPENNVNELFFYGGTGDFVLDFSSRCGLDVQGWSISYDSSIIGTISKNEISNLKGVKIKTSLISWLDIVKITRENDVLTFSTGPLSIQSFPVAFFEKSPKWICEYSLLCQECVVSLVSGVLPRVH